MVRRRQTLFGGPGTSLLGRLPGESTGGRLRSRLRKQTNPERLKGRNYQAGPDDATKEISKARRDANPGPRKRKRPLPPGTVITLKSGKKLYVRDD